MTFTRPSKENRRVVVTGMGLVSPLGNDLKTSWGACKNGESGVDKIASFDASAFSTQIAAEVKGFDPEPYVSKKDQKKIKM